MNYNNSYETLYKTLLNDRENFINILSNINEYNNLKNTIKKITDTYIYTNDLWHNLCVGKNGNNNNKYSAFYEIPTSQLIDSLSIIFQIYNIKKIDEVGAGMGLLTALLQIKFNNDNYNAKVLASDDFSLEHTSIPLDFTRIIRKDVSDIILQHNQNLDPPESIITSWPKCKNQINQLDNLIKSNYLKIIVIIDEITEKENWLAIFKKNPNYNVFDLPIYQYSFLDSHQNNKIDGLYSRSHTFVLIRNDLNNVDLRKILSPYLYESKEINPFRITFLDLAIVKNIPFWICELNSDNDINIIKNILKSIQIKSSFLFKGIPLWIPNLDLLIFWYTRMLIKTFPIKIKTEEKLIEYYNIVIDMSDEKIIKLKEDNILPQWISKNYVDKYVWLMYSVLDDDTRWKNNLIEFKRKFTRVYENTIRNYSSILSSILYQI